MTVVHNGIFENYLEFKEKFEIEGIEFKSETDTEVIAVMVNELLKDKELNR